MDASVLATRLKDHGLQQVLFNTPSGGTDTGSFAQAWDQGSRGTASVAGRETEFRRGFEQALVYAHALDCPRIHAMVGLRPDAISVEAADARAHLAEDRIVGRDGHVAHDVEHVATADGVAVRRPTLQRREDDGIEVSFEHFSFHT